MLKERSNGWSAPAEGAEAHGAGPSEEDLLVGWALGETAATRVLSDRELKLTAAIYVQLRGVLEHVRRHGALPRGLTIGGGVEIGVRLLVERRGLDIALTGSEVLVADAIKASGKVPAGCVALLDRRPSSPRRRP